MANKIQVKRGLKASLPLLNAGEPALCTDTKQIYVGDGTANIELANKAEVDSAIGQISNPNLLINGDFQIWQRGVSFGVIPANSYTADRWNNNEGSSLTEKTISGIKHITSSNPSGLLQIIEDFDGKLSNKVVTLSVLMKANTQIRLEVNGVSSNPLSCSDYTLLKFTTNIGTILNGKLPIRIRNAEFGVSTFEIKYVKLELGSVATPFSPRPVAEELATCQRYYNKVLITSMCSRTILQYDDIILYNRVVPMRTAPTCQFFNVLGTVQNIVSDVNSDDVLGTFAQRLNTTHTFSVSYRDAAVKNIVSNVASCLAIFDAEIY